MFANLLIKLLTQKFVINTSVHILEWAATKTDNKLDDKIVNEVKGALK